MRIRNRATPRHREPLRQALAASFPDDEVTVALELIDAAIAGTGDYGILLADQVDGAPEGVGGYVCFGPTPMTASTFDLYWVAVHPAARGRGVASALISAMEDAIGSQGATAIRVETEDTPAFEPARRMYRRLGYPVAARLDDFYGPGKGLVIYYKCLP